MKKTLKNKAFANKKPLSLPKKGKVESGLYDQNYLKNSKKEFIYISTYPFLANELLKTQLQKIKGLGPRNIFHFMKKIEPEISSTCLRNFKVSDLTEAQIAFLESLLEKGYLSVDPFFANKKKKLISSEYQEELFYNLDSPLLFLGPFNDIQVKLAKKRLINLNCIVGIRTKRGNKVHGQRTKTGARNKIIKGFQKNKKR